MRSLITVCAGLLLASQAVASEQPKLFKSWAYDAPMSVFTEAKGYYDCSADFGAKARCTDEVEFLGHTFGAVLIPSSERLQAVMLVSEFDQDIYVKAIGALVKGFTMVGMRGTSDQFDMVEAIRSSGNVQAFQTKVNDYETLNLNQGQLTYVFLEQPAEKVRLHKSAYAATSAAPNSARTAELYVVQDAEESALLIKFMLPGLYQQQMLDSVKQAPAEDF
ncbi:MAG: hypothetical protein KJ794_21915 [Gammaproteobacteria bacterium]|nr:hypothetical protein [Gammaproteobacteria bacterium]